MTTHNALHRLDVLAFARKGEAASGAISLLELPRLAKETAEGTDTKTLQLHWHVLGEWREDAAGTPQPWLRCDAQIDLPMPCPRCLQAVPTVVETSQWFRFVASEEEADAQDADAEEDVMALTPVLDVFQLIEDDALMALPMVVQHADCRAPAALSVQDAAFDAAQANRPNPFAKLAGISAQEQEKPKPQD